MRHLLLALLPFALLATQGCGLQRVTIADAPAASASAEQREAYLEEHAVEGRIVSRKSKVRLTPFGGTATHSSTVVGGRLNNGKRVRHPTDLRPALAVGTPAMSAIENYESEEAFNTVAWQVTYWSLPIGLGAAAGAGAVAVYSGATSPDPTVPIAATAVAGVALLAAPVAALTAWVLAEDSDRDLRVTAADVFREYPESLVMSLRLEEVDDEGRDDEPQDAWAGYGAVDE